MTLRLRAFSPLVLPLMLQGPPSPEAGNAPGRAENAAAKVRRERSFEFVYEAEVKDLPSGAKRADLWIPVPSSDAFQKVGDLAVESPFPHEFTTEAEYGNRLLHVAAEPASPFRVVMKFTLERKEQAAARDPEKDRRRARLLAPDRLVPLGGRALELAAGIAPREASARGKARAIYDLVLSRMAYDKSGTGWGRGDFDYACEVGKGNCSDFHSMFIGIARASGIPALFEIGFPIPADKKEGEIGGYHCWALFEDPTSGWTPADISEAWKNADLREYYFGRLTPDRAVFSRGRDLTLAPAQKGPALNFLVYPYLEVDGRPHEAVGKRFSFRDR